MTLALELRKPNVKKALYADFRKTYAISLTEIYGMEADEAISLIQALADDPGSYFFAASQGWKHPFSHEALLLAQLFDLTHQINSKKKVKPYPRPYDVKASTTVKTEAALSIDQIKELTQRIHKPQEKD